MKEGDLEKATEVARKMNKSVSVEKSVSGSYTDIKGVGPELAEEIKQVYGPYENFVNEAGVEGLSDIAGIGETSAEEILEQLE